MSWGIQGFKLWTCHWYFLFISPTSTNSLWDVQLKVKLTVLYNKLLSNTNRAWRHKCKFESRISNNRTLPYLKAISIWADDGSYRTDVVGSGTWHSTSLTNYSSIWNLCRYVWTTGWGHHTFALILNILMFQYFNRCYNYISLSRVQWKNDSRETDLCIGPGLKVLGYNRMLDTCLRTLLTDTS